tara:strand:- start:360 stop:773 length:414 start_codon:yes stop_codon:yes gene_type:complete
MSNQPIILNATAYWANLTTKNTLSGKYQIDLGNLSDAAVEKLKSVGINVKTKPEMDKFITSKSENEIRYYDSSGENITGVLVGNGSKVKVVGTPYDWVSPTGSKGRSFSLAKLIVTDLVAYEGNGVVDADIDLDEAL